MMRSMVQIQMTGGGWPQPTTIDGLRQLSIEVRGAAILALRGSSRGAPFVLVFAVETEASILLFLFFFLLLFFFSPSPGCLRRRLDGGGGDPSR